MHISLDTVKSVTKQVGLGLIWLETQKRGFLNCTEAMNLSKDIYLKYDLI